MGQVNSKVYEIKDEMINISKELQTISDSINSDFEGIGQYKCSMVLNNVISKCNTLKSRLEYIDPDNLAAGFGEKE